MNLTSPDPSIASSFAKPVTPRRSSPEDYTGRTEVESSIPELATHAIDADGICAYYQNVRGLRTKVDDLFLASSDCNYDVIMLTETGLDACIDSLQLFGSAFNVYRCDRSSSNSNKSSFGGVLIAVAQKFPSSIVNLSHGSCLEQVCVSAVIKGTKFLLAAVYIPPDRSKIIKFIDEHILSMRELCDKGSPDDRVLICGDYNQPQISWFNGENGVQYDSSLPLHVASAAVVDGFEFLNLKQANPLRNYLGRTLDLVYCLPEQEISVHCAITPLLPVDPPHPPLDLWLPVPVRPVEVPAATVGVAPLNYRRINFDALAEHLSSLDWETLLGEMEVDDMTLRFCDAICSWLNENLPRTRPPLNPAWSNSELRKLKRHRNAKQRLLRKQRTLLNKRAFKHASDAYRRLNSSLYKSYVLRMQFGLRANPKSFWTFVNSKRKSSSIPSSVSLGGTESSTVTESCELFADHFSSVFASGCTTQSDAELAASGVPVGAVDLDIFDITPAMVIAGAKKLKSSYSPGPDGVPAIIFCRCATALAVPLSQIFNKSFEQRKFPTLWKQSYMFPVFKKGEKRDVRNYRGITSLSAGSKLFEIIVSTVILNSTRNYISVDQHGFMPGRSVSTNLIEFTSTCISQMEAGSQIDAVYTDIKAAFDTVDHRILLHKLTKLGVSERLTSWLSSYLSGRTLRIKLDSTVSRAFSNTSGVPQGSNLGPLLFALYFNDIAILLGSGCVLVYADDLKIYLVVKSIQDCHRLQALLDTFADWCNRNKLTISIAKCVVITFHRCYAPISFDYQINGSVLERVDRINDLGVLLDNKLTFNQHYSAAISKASKQLGFITKIARDFTDPHCLKALYCALVRPILENACIIWNPYDLCWKTRIERVQRRFVRIALRHLPWSTPNNLPRYEDRCQLLDLDTLESRRKIQQATFVAKLLNNELDAPVLLSRIDFRASSRLLRSSNLLTTRFHRTLYGFYEPLTSCIRTFTLVEELFDFGNVSSRTFGKRIARSRMLQ